MEADVNAAIERLGAQHAPVLLRLPISHYCRKVEWALSACGVPYATIDVSLKDWRKIRRANPVEKTVPVLATDQGLVHGSHAILAWADRQRRDEADPLFPKKHAKDVIAWEAWMDRDVGHVVRREAYRVLATSPEVYARGRWDRVRMRLGRPLFRRILTLLKAERHEADDPRIVREAIERTIDRLRDNDTGYLYGDHVTAADLATAALLQPMVPIAEIRGFASIDGWGEFVQYVRTVKPGRLRRTAKRPAKEEDWKAFEVLNRADATIDRPLVPVVAV